MSNLNYATYSENDSGSPTTPSESYKSLSTQPQPQSQPQPQVPMPGSKHPLMRPKIQDRQRTGLYLICIHPCVTADKQARSWLTLASSSSRGAGLNVSADGSVIVIDGVVGRERVPSTWTAAAVPLPLPQVVILMPSLPVLSSVPVSHSRAPDHLSASSSTTTTATTTTIVPVADSPLPSVILR